KRGDKQDFEFKIVPSSLKEGETQIRATLTAGGSTYSEGYSLVTREDLESTYYYQPAIQRVSVVDVKIPNDVKIGYIMGAGDDIPTVLKQIGLDVTVIPAEKVASEDLSRYRTIVLGIRAYDPQKGGLLKAQYGKGVYIYNAYAFFRQLPAGVPGAIRLYVNLLAAGHGAGH